MTEKSGVPDSGPMTSSREGVSEFSKGLDEILQPLGVDTAYRSVHQRISDGPQDGVLDAILGGVEEGDPEQGPQTLAGIVDRLQRDDDVGRGALLPTTERRVDQFPSGSEMPIEAPFGHSEGGGDRFDSDRFDTGLTDHGQGGVGPVVLGQSIR